MITIIKKSVGSRLLRGFNGKINAFYNTLLAKLRFSKIHKLVIRWIAFANSSRNIYGFSDKDIDLYLQERKSVMPCLNTLEQENLVSDLNEIYINSTKIFWPTSLSSNDLPWLWHEVFDDFDHNPSSYNHPRLNISAKNWVIDAGAAEGFFSVFVASQTGRKAKIIALEPFDLMKTALLKTFEQFPDQDFTVIQAALGDEDKLVSFYIDESHICDSKIEANPHPETNSGKLVRQVTIDSLERDLNLSDGGLIKMDIEGYEMLALMGARETIKKLKPALAIAVYHDYENAVKCAQIIKDSNPTYHIEFRGYYGYFKPPRPYMLFAY